MLIQKIKYLSGFQKMKNSFNRALQTEKMGQTLILLDSIGSTNDYVKAEIPSEGFGKTVVIAKTQSHGRGQKTRTWCSPEGGLYYTATYRCPVDEHITLVTLLVGVAIQEAILAVTGLETSLKWINDILYQDKKLGGILVESKIKGKMIDLVIGIGININSSVQDLEEEIKDISTTLYDETACHYDVLEFAAVMTNCLERRFELYNSNKVDEIRQLWLSHAYSTGKKIRFSIGEDVKTGTVKTIDEYGALIVHLETGEIISLTNNMTIEYL